MREREVERQQQHIEAEPIQQRLGWLKEELDKAEAKSAERTRYEVERTKQAEEREKAASSTARQAEEQLREFQANLRMKIEGDTAKEQALRAQVQAEGDRFKASVIAEAQEEVFRLKQELAARSGTPMETDLSESLRAEAQKGKEEISRLLGQLGQETRAKNSFSH